MAVVHPTEPRRRSPRLPLASPHGILYAVPISIALWVAILIAVGVIS